MRVIVTDADDKKSIAAVRSLGRKGVYVCSVGVKRWDQSQFSKYARERLLCPNPVRDPQAFAARLLDFVSKNHYDSIQPMSDYSTIALSMHKADFSKYTALSVPDIDVLTLARDKPRILDVGRELGIPAPRTWCPANVDEVRELACEVPYPCVVKYKKGTGAVGIRYAHTREQLLACYQVTEHAADIVFDDVFPMIQEYIPGYTCDTSVLYNNGEPRAAIDTRRLRTHPANGGRGVLVQAIWEPRIREQALRLLGAIGWHGPCQVEFRHDTRDGSFKLMEVNTRYWGGIDVSAQAGIDMVYMAAKMAIEGDVEPAWDYDVGMLYRWPFPLDFQSMLQREDRLEALFEYLDFRKGTRYDLSAGDPLPHIVSAGLAAYGWARRVARRPGA